MPRSPACDLCPKARPGRLRTRRPRAARWRKPVLAVVALTWLSSAAVVQATPQATPAASRAEDDAGLRPARGEAALFSRLRAPCCWNQTLDVHDSGLGRTLRREIRRRLHAGEAARVIEADLVARYGERIRAVPLGNPLGTTATWMLVLVALCGAALVIVARRRWRRVQGASTAASPAPAAAASAAVAPTARIHTDVDEAALDAVLDAELERLDGDVGA